MGQSKPFSRPTVLVVDCDMEERALLSTLFEASDLTVIECSSAEAAFAAMRERPHDIAMVFTDLPLAGRMDGVDLARIVSRDYPATRVLVVGGKAMKRLRDLPDSATFVQRPWLALDLLKEAERLRPSDGP